MKTQLESEAVGDASDACRLRRVLKESDRDGAVAAIDGWTSEQRESNGRGIDLTAAVLTNADLSSLNLRGATFNRATLHGTRLDHADLSGASLICPAMEKTSLRKAKFRGAYLHALAAQVCDFTQADLSSVLDATGSLLHGCQLVEAILDRSSLAGATFYQCDLRGSSWKNATLQGATFNECLLDDARFDTANLDQVTMTKCRLNGVRFDGATGHGLTIQRPTAAGRMRFDGAALSSLRLLNVRGAGWSVRRAQLRDVDVVDCYLASAAFTETNVAGGRFLRSDLAGADFSAAQAENATIIESGLEGASLETIRARGLVVRDTDLSEASLRSAYLYRAMLTGDPPRAMSLRGADLQGANLVQSHIAADLSGANLVGVHAAYARLNQSVLRDADLRGISLFDASLVKTDFSRARLSELRPPFFADRCPGLQEAVAVADDTTAAEFLNRLGIALRHGVSTSTLT